MLELRVAKRIRRIRGRDHTPREFAAFVVVAIAMVVVQISWLMTHPDTGHHHHADAH